MPTYSHSRLETYSTCPQQYKLHYIDRVEIEEFEGIEAFMGGRVHETLEKLYKDVRMTRLPSEDEVLAYYDKVWEENWHEGVTIVRTDYTPENYKEVGRRAVAQYYGQHHPFNASKIIGIEHLIFFPLDDKQTYWIRGVIDRLAQRKDGTYEIHDYKTSNRLMTQGEADKDRQLALYHLAIERAWPDVKDVDLIWHYLVFGKELTSHRTPDELRTLREELMDDIRAIERDRDFRPRESPLCDWCAYPQFCPAKKHAVMTSALPANKYLEEPGVRLVNAYADLQRRKRDVEDEMDQVKAALVEYARERAVEVVRGSDHKALVRVYRGVNFPGKDEPAREVLEDLVRKSGLWDRVSMLSTIGLAKLVESRTIQRLADSGELDRDIADRILALARQEDRPWVKLSHLRSDRD